MKLSDTIQAILADYPNQPVAIATLLDRTGEQGFGIISGLMTLPLIIPLPVPLAGFSTLMGSGTILMGLQLALGFRQPYLPKSLARLELSPAVSQRLLKNLQRILHPVERLAYRRLLSVSGNPTLRRLLGLCLFWNALLLALPLPIPFTNVLPAYTILFLSIGTLESDGLLILVGYGMTIATTLFFASIASTILALLQHLGQLLRLV
jgi:hypothetical protein